MSKIFIYDEFNPEDIAMMQALYSRSAKSVTEHVDKVKATGSGKFMARFYVGYGHSSIADCGSTTIFIENVSILADKAIQDWQLYSGQETSTRYIDMGQQEIVDPISSSETKNILSAWMDFYISNQDHVQEHLLKQYPRQNHEDEIIYLKAIKARVFDIMRGFLPAGITTQLSWHTNLRQAWDHLSLLRHHPLNEVKDTANLIIQGLKNKYSHSFSHELNDDQEKYRAEVVNETTYFPPQTRPDNFHMQTNIEELELNKYLSYIEKRPPKTILPHFLGDLGNINFNFILDFGSFRDIQRHRSGICRMPLLTTSLGFNDWYLNQLPEDLKQQAIALIETQKNRINELKADPVIKQYYTAIGFNVDCKFTFLLPGAVYVTELRSNKTVHPSLRKIAHQMHQALLNRFPTLKLHSDLDPDDWDIRRGLADIIQK